MTRISVHCELHYTVAARSSFSFAVLAARNPRQQVDRGALDDHTGAGANGTPFEPSGHD